MSNVCFYSPYLSKPHFGGGERHLLSVALEVAKKRNVQIGIIPLDGENELELASRLISIKKQLQEFFNFDLKKLEFVVAPFYNRRSFISKLLWTAKYDYLYYASDGSIFISLAKKNNLHIQIPFTDEKGWFDKLKLQNWQIKNTNSNFTKKIIEKYWETKIDFVHYPQLDPRIIKQGQSKKKKNIILSVGRFFKQLHAKRQDVLIDIFTKLQLKYPDVFNNWKLVLVGTIEDEGYFKALKLQAKDFPVEFKPNLDRNSLLELYQSARIYWHAAGFEIDETERPENVEHFGISTLEAMAGGAVPIVHGKGGQKEVLGNDLHNLMWQTPEQCMEITYQVISNNSETKLREIIKKQVNIFSEDNFRKVIWQMFQ